MPWTAFRLLAAARVGSTVRGLHSISRVESGGCRPWSFSYGGAGHRPRQHAYSGWPQPIGRLGSRWRPCADESRHQLRPAMAFQDLSGRRPSRLPFCEGVDLAMSSRRRDGRRGGSFGIRQESTLLHLLGGLDRPDSQEEGDDLRSATSERWGRAEREHELAGFRNRTLGFVFQFHQLLPDFTALENVMIPGPHRSLADRRRSGCTGKRWSFWDRSGAFGSRLDHFPQRALRRGASAGWPFARALWLWNRPILLADEPTGQPGSRKAGSGFWALLSSAFSRAPTAPPLVLVTHNPSKSRARCAVESSAARSNGVLHASPP